MTARLLEKEVLELSVRSRLRLAKRIIESIDDWTTPQLKAAWDEEIDARVKEIKSGSEAGISAEEVMKEARRSVNEARRLSSTRRT
jgi:putative addiction module component (TIGR02574 family)